MTSRSSRVTPPLTEAGVRRLKGRTRRGRLALLDAFLVEREAALLTRGDGAYGDALFVDVGVGDEPWTTLECAEAFRQLNPALRSVGCESDPIRLASARRHASEQVSFVANRGGFTLPPLPAAARLVRAMNLLRSYPASEVDAAHAALSAPLLPGGLLVEGTSSGEGAVLCCHLIRRQLDGLAREAILFATDFRLGFGPLLFRDWLPRDLRRHARHGEPIGDFLFAWQRAFEEVRTRGRLAPLQLFAASAELLAARVAGVSGDHSLLQRGYLLWQTSVS